MPDTVKQVQYFYTEVLDKPGEGARLLNTLKEAGVNLLAYSGFPKGRRAQIDFFPADVAAFRAAARKGKLTLVGPKTGFLIQGENQPGAVAELIAKLSEAKINVTACDAVAAGEGRYGHRHEELSSEFYCQLNEVVLGLKALPQPLGRGAAFAGGFRH